MGKLGYTAIAVVMMWFSFSGAVDAQTTRPPAATSPEYTFKVVHEFPHDAGAFTQGLVYKDGFLYEGTGLYGRSCLRKVKLETGEVLQQVNLSSIYFGEGIAILGDRIVQLTYQSHKGFIYNSSDFRLVSEFSYPGEGWGLASNGHDLFMSDGTAEIRVLDGRTLVEKRRFKVHDGDHPVSKLNELEFR